MSLPADPAPLMDASSPSPIRRRWRWWKVLAGLAIFALAGWLGGSLLCVAFHLHAAEKALARYDYPEALNKYESALRVWPYGTGLRLKAARAARRGDQLELAGEYLSACESAGTATQIALERAMLRAQKGDLAEVESDLRGLIFEDHPDSVLILESLARGYIRTHHRREAIVLLSRELLPRAPDHSDALYWLGSQLEEAGLIADAVPNYQKALQLAPHRADFRLKLADALVRSNQPSEAWPQFELLLRQSHQDASVLLGAARCRRALGKHPAAREHLDTLLRGHPDHAEAWAERGRVCREQGESAEALRCLRRAFQLAPGNYAIAFSLLAELRGQHKIAEAETLWKKIERLAEQGKHLRELTSQLNRPGRNAPARYEVGMIQMNNKAQTEAEGWLLGAVQDDPRYQPAHAALADYYERTGNAGAADYHRRRAVGEKP
jgi:tetratricopeptide (TPR) repeat protein